MFKKFCYDSGVEGVKILFLGAVHGNEIAGTVAQQQIISDLESGKIKLKKGKITFIPCVNEKAQKADVRFVDVNLNRVIKYHQQPTNNEEKIANQLVYEIDNCDVMLDLHSTHCEGDEEFAFIDYPKAENKELLSLMPVEKALAGWPEIYKSKQEIDDFCTERYAFNKGKTGITLECGYHKAEYAIEIAKKAMLNVLAYYRCIEAIFEQPQMPCIVQLDSFVIKKTEGKLSKNYKHMMQVKNNEVLAIYDDGEKIISPYDGYIIMPNHDAKICSEWFYLGRQKV